MPTFKTLLKNRIKGARRIAILGIGSSIRSDDAAGVLVAQKLKQVIAGKKTAVPVRVYSAESAPENITGEIKKFAPTHLFMIDAADFTKKPGTISLIDPREVYGESFSTHRLPVTVVAKYLFSSFACQITIIGIQPKSLEVCGEVSKEVAEAVSKVSKALYDVCVS